MKHFVTFCKERNIFIQVLTRDPHKSYMAEMAVKFFKNAIFRELKDTGRNSVPEGRIQQLVRQLNGSPRKSLLDLSPNEITYENQSVFFKRLSDRGKTKSTGRILHKGDVVRIRTRRRHHTSSFSGPLFSIEKFRISEVETTEKPYMYKLVDFADAPLSQRFYARNLALVEEEERTEDVET